MPAPLISDLKTYNTKLSGFIWVADIPNEPRARKISVWLRDDSTYDVYACTYYGDAWVPLQSWRCLDPITAQSILHHLWDELGLDNPEGNYVTLLHCKWDHSDLRAVLQRRQARRPCREAR